MGADGDIPEGFFMKHDLLISMCEVKFGKLSHHLLEMQTNLQCEE